MTLPTSLQPLAGAFLAGLQRVLSSKLVGVYIYGAAVFPDGGVVQDVDFHVIVAAELAESEQQALQDLHVELAQAFPGQGDDMDGYYLLLSEARRLEAPQHQFLTLRDESWALHCAHIRAGRSCTVFGPDPLSIYPQPTWKALDLALQGELAFLQKEIERYPAYAVLNLSRLLYSYATKDVVISKQAAAAWAQVQYPAWADLIEAALASYAKKATAEQRALLADQARVYYCFVGGWLARFRAE
ncbi:MAG: DUF4111 domain-containing protein [Anaerolineales bacterium]|nr:DUF4111 domain-containing protein [Anaerolineales bacterium]